MHCVSSYPCLENKINLNKIDKLKKITSKIGYSGHYSGIDDAQFAMVKGAIFY